MSAHVIIAIVSYRCPDEVRECLQHLDRLDDTNFEVRICENGGRDAYDALVRACAPALAPSTEEAPGGPRIVASHAARLSGSGRPVFIQCANANLGYAGGVNASLEASLQDPGWSSVWVLNPDTAPDRGALRALVERLESGPYGVVGSRLIYEESRVVQLYGGRWRRWIARGFNLGRGAAFDAVPDVPAVERAMSYVAGTSMLVSRAYIESVGLMDERYFLYHEEVDWCFRRGGFRLGYAHDSVVMHAHGATMGSSAHRHRRSSLSVYLEERNKLLFTKRFYPAIYPFAVVSTLLLIPQYLTSGGFANFRVALKGWAAGLKGETGPPAWHGASSRHPLEATERMAANAS